MRIGIDVGGTNTDAVLMDGREIKAFVKATTTSDVGAGIAEALRQLLRESGVAASAVRQVMIGTTHFVNAFVERKGLSAPMVLRIGLPAARGVPPTSGWPSDLRALVAAHVTQVAGGFQFTGREISPLDELAVAHAARAAHRAGIRSAAISCIFSHVDDRMERRAADIVRQEAPEMRITLSSEVGRIGMLERENAAIINAALIDMAEHVIAAFKSALRALGVTAPLYVSQNDGTLMTTERAAAFPVFTFASGPTNSMRGAAYLTGRRDAVVADIGGTTTDAGALVNGFPREAAFATDFGGVRTNFRMPDLVSVGLGGGSLVRESGGRVAVGPESVGYRLTQDALVFGGKTLTATDVVVAAGLAEVGDPALVKHLSAASVNAGIEAIHAAFGEAVDRIKVQRGDAPLILVGGGAILISGKIAGVSETIVPRCASVANAVGASIAQVGGEVDRVFLYQDRGRDSCLEEARGEAIRRALDAGAATGTVEVVDILELNLISMPREAVRVRVRAVGDLAD